MDASTSKTKSLPVSALQQGMWLVEHLGGEQPLVRSVLRIRGHLDPRRLARAIAAVIGRHELLQCGFRSDSATLERFRAQPREDSLRVIDVMSCSRAGQWVDRLLAQLDRVRLDLSQAPLVRFVLVRQDAENSILWMVIHHIVCDQHSNTILCRDILTAYAARPYTHPPGSFTQLLQRSREQHASEVSREFWRSRLRHCEVSGVLQQMHRRMGVLEADSGILSIRHVLDRQDTARIEKLCRAYRCTPSVLLLGLMQIWLARSCAGCAPPVCVPMQLREDPDEDGVIGFLTNLVVIPSVVRDNDTATAHFNELRTRFYEAWDHRQTPFTEVAALFSAGRAGLAHPMSRYMFVLETPPAVFDEEGPRDLTIESLCTDGIIPGTDLAVIATLDASASSLRVQYRTRAIASPWAESALPAILGLLGTLSSNPDARLANVSLLRTSSGRRDRALDTGPRRSLYQRFREVSRRFPDRTAVYSRHPQTYAELAARVDDMTALLIADGVRAGDLVGLALGRGLDLIAGQLAVVRLGAAYVPLSADVSSARVIANLRQALVDGSVSLQFSADCKVRSIGGARVELASTFIDPQVPASAIACVLFTSGSGGAPQGVAVDHGSLECFIEWSQRYFHLTAEDVVFGVTPASFGMSISELLVPACTGMSTFLVKHAAEACWSPDWDRVTWITGVPTVQRELVKSARLPRALRLVTLGGEEIDRTLVENVRRGAPAARIVSLSGSTEVTVFSTGAEVTPGTQVDPIPVGRELTFHRVRIVDTAINELPPWCVGQVVTGGPCVGIGYLDKPGATALQFIPDPFSSEPGARLHLSGDLGYTDSAGEIHLLGRMNSQEKILGVHVDMTAVEATLRRHPAVADAACFVINRGSATAYLAAALVRRSAAIPATEELRAWLHQTCTASHMPRQWVWFERLATRSAGKVDRPAVCAELEWLLRTRSADALSAQEHRVLAVWRKVIVADIDDVDLNFFDAGGHSLHLPRLCVELRIVGLSIEPAQIFEHPTVRAQARLMTQQQRCTTLLSVDPLQAAESRGARMRSALTALGSEGSV